MDKIRTSQLWQDTLLAINQKLLLQTDIESVLRLLKLSCMPVTQFQRVNLLLVNPVQQCVTIYTLEESAQKFVITKATIEPTQEQMLFWYQHKESRYDNATLQKDFPSIAELRQYGQFCDCYHLPLTTPNSFLGAIEFITTDGSSFDDHVISFLSSLSHILAGMVEHLLTIETFKKENARLRQERDHFSILVDITNTAIANLDMTSMVTEVAKEVQRYFGINFFGLALHHPENSNAPLSLYSAYHHPNGKIECHKKVENTNSQLFKKTLQTNQPIIFKENALREIDAIDPLSPVLNTHQLKGACVLPLNFSHHIHGVLFLAHDDASVFSEPNVKLLHQIADRVAIAVHNVLDYERLAVQKEELKHENLYLAEQIQIADSFGEIVGSSNAIRKVLAQVEMVANSDSTVLILGETGTGKELFARAIHNRSTRNARRMIKINCAAVPSGLLESELFGHEKGAFTGAFSQRKGRFELADGSTLMLDEVGDIPLEMQPKLLRVLQEREIERLGNSKVIPVDVRLIAATNCNLKQMVEDKKYRADLYYRLNVFPIIVPPLRERKEDIPPLAHFLTKKMAQQMRRDITTISSQAIKQLCDHHWPGNIRELANVIERAIITSSGTTLDLQMHELKSFDDSAEPIERARATTHPQEEGPSSVPFASSAPPTSIFPAPSSPPPAPTRHLSYPEPVKEPSDTDLERERILTALKESNGVVAGPRGAAAKLDLKRTTLLSRMQRLGISAKDAFEDEGTD